MLYDLFEPLRNNDLAIENMLEEVIRRVNLPPDCQALILPTGQVDRYPIKVGAILARQFHFLCYLNLWHGNGLIDIYSPNIERHIAAITEIIGQYHQLGFICPYSSRNAFKPSAADYASFHLYRRYTYAVSGKFNLPTCNSRPYSTTLYLPPCQENGFEYDMLRVHHDGYITLHASSVGLEVDILSNPRQNEQENSQTRITAKNLRAWLGEDCRDLRLLHRFV